MKFMVDYIYVSHSEKLKDRFDYITKIENHSFFSGKTEIISFTESDDKKSKKNNTYHTDSKWYNELKDTEIFIAEQMLHIYQKVVENNFKKTLILEDDFILSDNFENSHKKIFETLPDDFDCVFMSTCGGLSVPNNFGGEFWESETSRCTCAHVVSLNFCKKILEKRNYFSPIDWHLNFIKKELGFKYYWTKEFLFTQGSENNYKSNLR